MRQTNLLLLFTLLVLNSVAQDLQPLQNSYVYFFNDPWLQHLNSEGKKIKQINIHSSKYPKDDNYMVLNSDGQILERKFTNRWSIGPFNFKSFYFHKDEFKNGDLVKTDYLDKKGELEHRYLYEYAFPRKIKHSQSFRKEEKFRESFTDYNSDSTQKEYRVYKIKNDKQKLTLRYEYEYYTDKQKKETRQYNKKNKLKHTWKYDCNPKGEVTKEETQVCKNTGLNNKGQIVDVIFNTNAKGKKTKYVQVYYLFNGKKIYVSYENYVIKKGKEIKTSDAHLADSLEPYYQRRNYDKKGNLVAEWKDEYLSYTAGNTIQKKSSLSFHNKGKITYRREITYDAKGLPLVSESFDKKNKSYGKAVYKYEGDDSYTVDHYNKKQKLKEIYTGKLVYY